MKAEWTNRDNLSIETTGLNSKAVLVIDMPNGYGDITDNKAVVTLRNGKLGTSLGIYNVPLKPLPKKMAPVVLHQCVEDEYLYQKGWNDCLKEITE